MLSAVVFMTRFKAVSNWRVRGDRFLVFVCTFLAYALMHATRKTLSSVKPLMIANLVGHMDNTNITLHPQELWYNAHPVFSTADDAAIFMGTLDFLFLLSYALGLYVTGWLGDLFDPRNVLAGGMFGGAVTTFLFGVPSQWGHFYNRYWYGILWFINGFLQAPGWPAGISLVAHSFPSARGLVLGLWSTSAGVGNIIGALLSSAVIDYGYEFVFFTASCLLAGAIFLVLAGVPTGIVRTAKPEQTTGSDNHVPLYRIFCLPELICYALAYAGLKLVNYSFFFWLPFYLHNKFNWDAGTASALSAFFDLGGLFGGIVGGGISDLPCVSRNWVNIVFLMLCVPCLLVYRNTPGSPWALNGFVMGITGFMIAGPANLLSAVVGTDLAALPQLQGRRVLSTMTGFIDGTGSLGAAMGQILVPVLQARLGWDWVFHLFLICCILTLIFVAIPLCIRWVSSRGSIVEELAPIIAEE
ncbi:Sugar phosphate exchanger 3 [Echinococcus granulosus]|uniref:Sugar phosphate exchanger 3 n=1 Tax=Echinococcus granulosus TaxID=6210 RepID=W6UBT8_ECHGR|nr:Sugar phosphate exchanger 3 [Echinococcus granulosus]EUB58585.1 Sugar phosphate exchanger 3 [Echinococcus granulosus]